MNEITKCTIDAYKNYLIEEEKCSVTIEKYIRDINTFAEWSHGREITVRNNCTVNLFLT